MKETQNKQDNPEIANTLSNDEVADATVVQPNAAEATEDSQDETTTECGEELDDYTKLTNELDATKAALDNEKKEYLFLMADFDNFRKRIAKEKIEILKNAAESTLKGLLPIVDDFERGIDATKGTNNTEAEAIRQGMELIYNKFVKFLNDNGVKAMDSNGQVYDVDLHEAIATIPAADESQKGLIIDTTQKGYTINDKVLRYAKVVVAQ